jgi:hypothetical protein
MFTKEKAHQCELMGFFMISCQENHHLHGGG